MADIAMRDGGLDLTSLSAALSAYGVRIGARRVSPGDEAAFADPGSVQTASNLPRRRASGAARIVARRLLGELGADASAPLRRSPSGAPFWPEGVVGSLAHDDEFAVAAVALRTDIARLGVDIEPAEPLPSDIVDRVLSVGEKRLTNNDRVMSRLIFSSKEAVYKALNALDGSPLEYDDIEIRLAEATAILRDGRSLRLVAQVGERLVAVAFA
ncbi:MAG: 4'-phosphopantetheinyl transferase superfamily protein [Roseiarcus sp.]|jgi:4'-phosphopantetheinyl transferase EntD